MTDRLRYASVLVECGWLHDAEAEVASVLDESPGDLDALGLYAKIKHIRGELSQAIACWAQLHMSVQHDEPTLLQLGALLHFAQDPEAGAGEYLAVGPNRLVKKPAGQLALERAFRLFVARRPDDARAECAVVARKHGANDPQIVKLATLASAWISELSGDLSAARDTLEAMGKVRGFEIDAERLLALARVDEAIGTREALEAAVKIYRYLDENRDGGRGAPASASSALARLYRKLELSEQADSYEQRQVREFRARMFRPTFSDVVAVAAERYMPLITLRGAVAAPDDGAPITGRIQRAVGAALVGDWDAAEDLFEDTGTIVDRKYLADIAALRGDREQAVERFVSCFADDPDDLHVIGWLLDHQEHAPTPAIVRALSGHAQIAHTAAVLERATQLAPMRPSLWRHLAQLHRIAGNVSYADQCFDRAAILASTAREGSHPIGRVLSASVYHFIGTARGLIHEVWVHREPAERGKGGHLPPDHILGNLDAEMKIGVRNTFLAVREYARTKFPQRTADLADYNYTYKIPKEDEPSGGLSAGLPSALAFLSSFLQRPVRQDVAFSGVVVSDAHDVLTIRRVGEADHKVEAAYHRNLRRLVLPMENVGDLGTGRVPAAVCAELVELASTVGAVVEMVFGSRLFAPPPARVSG